VNDSQCFLLEHFDTICKSPSQIYHSALLLSPSSSWLYKCYTAELSQEVRVVKGHPAEWEMSSRTVSFHKIPWTLACWEDTIAVGLESGDVVTLDGITGSQVTTLSGHTGWVGTLSFSLDGTLLVSGSNDKTLKLWGVQTGGVVKTFHGHINWVFSVSISADHTIIVSGSKDQTIRLWNVQMGECYHVMEQQRQVYHVSFSPTNPWHFMSVSYGDYSWSMTSVQKWDIDGHQVGPTYRCPSKAFSTNGTHFISHCEGVFIVQNFDTGGIVAKCLVSSSSPNPSHFHSCTSPNGRLVAFSVIHTIYVWDITGSDPLLIETFTGHTNNILSLTFSSPSTLISASMDQLVKFWQIGGLSADSVPGDPKPILPISSSITSVSLQVGDNVAISCDFGGVVRVWDISVTTSPFWPCFLALFFLLFAPSSRVTQDTLQENKQKTSHNQDSATNTTVAKHYLLNGRRRPQDPPSIPESHHAPDHPPRPGRTPETESTGQPKTVEGLEERTPQGSPPTCG
jgi:WD40 repeat protein